VRGAKEVRGANPAYFDWLISGGRDAARGGGSPRRFAQRDGGASDDDEDGEAPVSPMQGSDSDEDGDDGDNAAGAIDDDAASAAGDNEGDAEVSSALASLDSPRAAGAAEGAADMSPVTDDDDDDGEGGQEKDADHSAVDMEVDEAPNSPDAAAAASDDDDDDGAAANPFDDDDAAGAAPAPVRMTLKRAGGSVITSEAVIAPGAEEAFSSDVPEWTEESALKRRVTSRDVQRVANTATEDELDIVHEHLT
jgi:hypothetical protein